jgi:hypothetical protein
MHLLPFTFITINNESLELEIWKPVWRYVMNVAESSVWNKFHNLMTERMAMLRILDMKEYPMNLMYGEMLRF